MAPGVLGRRILSDCKERNYYFLSFGQTGKVQNQFPTLYISMFRVIR